MRDLIIFGSARIDAFLEVPDDKVDTFCRLNEKDCVIELSYASKIPMKRVQFLVGGNGANVSVGTKRLGLDSLLVAEVGSDLMGNNTKTELENAGIDIQFVTQTNGVPGGFGAIIVYQGERTILSYYPPMTPPFPEKICDTKWAYLTSTGEAFEEYYEKIYNWLSGCEAKLAFNPGGRQIAKGTEWMKKFLERTEIILVNRQEAEKITGVSDTYKKERDLLKALHGLGPKIPIVTDGMNGTYAFDGEKFLHIGVMPIDAIERTGAGDAFSSGTLSAIIQGKPLEEALKWATLNSTSVIGYFGPQKGLLTQDDFKTWFERADSCGLKVEEF